MNNRRGFTLIELMVVVAIIGILASIGSVRTGSALEKAKIAVRKETLISLRSAIVQYYLDNGHYPCDMSKVGVLQYYTALPAYGLWTQRNDYIPGLAPQYIRNLPNDPSPHPSINPACVGGYWGGYYYTTTCTDYKLNSSCTSPQSFYSSRDPMIDPLRTDHSWQVSSNRCMDAWKPCP